MKNVWCGLALLAAALSMGACAPIHTNWSPAEPVAINHGVTGNLAVAAQAKAASPIVAGAKAVIDTQSGANPTLKQIAQQVKDENMGGKLLEQLPALDLTFRKMGEQAATLYLLCSRSPDAAIRQKGTAFGSAALQYAKLQDELVQSELVYAHAWVDWNRKPVTKERQDYQNALAAQVESAGARFSALAGDFSQALAHAAQAGQTFDPPTLAGMTASSGPAKILIESGTGQEEMGTLHDAFAKELGTSALHSGDTLTINLKKVEGGHVTALTVAGLFLFPPLPSSRIYGGGDSSFSATLTVGNGAPMPLLAGAQPVVARDPKVMLDLIARQVVSAAHFALLQSEMHGGTTEAAK